ncbi:MAG: methyltransferase domain-containing protein [Candidatus Eremiobacterota bacterium]
MKATEFLTLLGVGLENLGHLAALSAREAARLGRYRWWWRLRLAMAAAYALDPAFRVCLREAPNSGLPEHEATFGETPMLTAYEWFRELGIGRDDTVVDMGCGRGGTVLLAAAAFGARGIGLEVLPTFVARARAVARRLELADRVSFEQCDFRQGPLPRASLYLLSGTCLERESWDRLKRLLVEAPGGARAISISMPLPGLTWEPCWERRLPYSWGYATTYLQRRLEPRGNRRKLTSRKRSPRPLPRCSPAPSP